MISIKSYCRITDDAVILDGDSIGITPSGKGSWLGDIYSTLEVGYPKFFKMDRLSKAGFLGACLVLEKCGFDHETPKEDVSVVLMNRSSSLDNDTAYTKTIGPDEFFPSPAVFVYTLANIVAGEIAIRYKIKGETSFYVSEGFCAQTLCDLTEGAFSDPAIKQVLCGWTEYFDGKCDVFLMLAGRTADGCDGMMEFSETNINNLYKL